MEAKFLASVFSFLSIFLAIYAQSDEPGFLVPNYDNNNKYNITTFDISKALVLFCNITKDGTWELKWEKNGTDVREVKSLENRFKILKEERKFIIEKAYDQDAGTYSCVLDSNNRKDFNVIAKIQLRVPSNPNVVEGERLSIVCTVIGTDPQLSWTIGKQVINETGGRYTLKPNENVKNAILEVADMEVEDRGHYTCVGTNNYSLVDPKYEVKDAAYVRVKGKFAALWPFLGICLEVLILCAIILIYEKRRNKSELEESDTDPQEQ